MSSTINKVQVLGSGCPSCHKLLELSQQALKDLGMELEIEYVTEIDQIIAMGIMSTPALAINGQPVLSGRVPSVEELKKIFLEHK